MRTETMNEGEFFFLSREQEDKLMELNGLIYKAVTEDKNILLPEHVVVGKLCIANFQDELYRAEIMAVDEPNRTVRVFFMDYGNTSTCPFSELYQVDDKYFKEYIRFVIFCKWDAKLVDKSVKDQFSDEDIEITLRKKVICF